MELFDHTDFNGATYSYSELLNGGSASQVGLAKTLKVAPGDVIHAEVFAKYWNSSSTTSNITGFAAALTGAFGLSAGATGEALKAYNALNNYGGIVAGAGGSGGNTAPKAFITVLQFDQNFNFVDAAWDQVTTAAEQVGATPKAAFELLSSDVTIREPGYVYIYISNENPTLVDVYFDDLSITHTKSNVVQYNEYYPFGLQNQNSWTRENTTGNNFLYNQGSEINLLTGIYETFFRSYDPTLGRFLQIDPLADKYSSQTGYAYGNNDPIFFSDPLGAEGTSWSADFDDMYLGSDWNTRKTRAMQDAKSAQAMGGFNNGYNSPLVGVDFSFTAIHLSDIGFGFGDLYQVYENTVSISGFINRARNGNGGYWNNGKAYYYTAEEAEERVAYYRRAYFDTNATSKCDSCPTTEEYDDYRASNLIYFYSPSVSGDGVYQALYDIEIDSHTHSGDPMEVPTFLLHEVVMGTFLSAVGGGGGGGGRLARGVRATKALKSARTAKSVTKTIQQNRAEGNLFRDELAEALRSEGRIANTEAYKWTPFGRRYIDIDVWHNGVNVGGIEAKLGSSRYLPLQRLKDTWLAANGYPVQLVRKSIK